MVFTTKRTKGGITVVFFLTCIVVKLVIKENYTQPIHLKEREIIVHTAYIYSWDFRYVRRQADPPGVCFDFDETDKERK